MVQRFFVKILYTLFNLIIVKMCKTILLKILFLFHSIFIIPKQKYT